MSRILLVARLDIKRVLSRRANVLWLVVLPIVLSTALSFAFGGGQRFAEGASLTLVLAGEHPSAGPIRSALAARGNLILEDLAGRDPHALLADRTADAVIVLAGFEGQVDVRILYDPSRQAGRAAMAAGLAAAQGVGVEDAAAELAVRIAPPGVDSDTVAARAAELAGERGGPALQVEVARAAERVLAATGAEQASMSQALLFALMFAAQAGASLLVERESGTLNRLVQSPVARWEIIAGKLAARVSVGVLQLLVLMIYGRVVMGVDWFARPLEVGLVLLAFTFFAAAYGLMFGAIFRSADQLGAVAMVSVFAMSALGGLLWPLEIVPETMRRFGSLLPTGAAMVSLTDLVSRGQGWESVLRGAGILAGYCVVALAIGVRGFRTDA